MCLDKFCCCFSLRIGLLVWGFINLVVDICITISGLMSIYEPLIHILISGLYDISTIFEIIGPDLGQTFFGLINTIFSILLIVGALEKNLKLLKVYFYYVLTVTVLQSLAFIITIGNIGILISTASSRDIGLILLLVLVFIISVSWQVYLALLVRSEYLKLERSKTQCLNNMPLVSAPVLPTAEQQLYPRAHP